MIVKKKDWEPHKVNSKLITFALIFGSFLFFATKASEQSSAYPSSNKPMLRSSQNSTPSTTNLKL